MVYVQQLKMVYVQQLIISLLASVSVIAAAAADQPRTLREPVGVSGKQHAGQRATKEVRMTAPTLLDRVATAVDGAESSYGKDIGMWRPDPSAPQGPMQVSAAAAVDVGGGDRFDLTQNRAIGRAYLAQLYGRYRNWPDAIAAYNWGRGKMDSWVNAGRPADKFLIGVASYLKRVLHDSGLCDRTQPKRLQQSPGSADLADGHEWPPDASISICTHLYNGHSPLGLSKAITVGLGRALGPQRSRFEMEVASARLSWHAAMRDLFGCTAISRELLRCR